MLLRPLAVVTLIVVAALLGGCDRCGNFDLSACRSASPVK